MSVVHDWPLPEPDERVLSWYLSEGWPPFGPVFLALTAHPTGEADLCWYVIRACRLDGSEIGKPRVFGSKALARQRWLEASGGAELLPEEVFEAVG